MNISEEKIELSLIWLKILFFVIDSRKLNGGKILLTVICT